MRVRDGAGNWLSVGDRVASREKRVDGGRIVPARTGLVIDLYPSNVTHRSRVKVELDDDEYREVVTKSLEWLKLESN